MEQIDEIMCGQGILNINSVHEVDFYLKIPFEVPFRVQNHVCTTYVIY